MKKAGGEILAAGAILVLSASCVGLGAAEPSAFLPISIRQTDGLYRVEAGGQPFADYVFKDTPRPILYPLLGPGGLPLTRNYPMKKDVPFESTDHPHHRSFWFTHGKVNGVDFWTEGKDKGAIVQRKLARLEEGKKGRILTENDWIAPDGRVVCTDKRTLTFMATESERFVDFSIIWLASHGPLLLGDSKEGLMAIRTHPGLQLVPDPKAGFEKATGRAVNSEGVASAEIWGKRARWVHYQGLIDGKPVGIAIFDHPKNLRHPTWWMARDYGLVAANPFGIHDFENKPGSPGDLQLPAGGELRLNYRFLFHAGERTPKQIDEAWTAFAGAGSK